MDIKRFYKIVIVALAILGIGIMSYLSFLHFSGASESFCDLGENLSCSSVNQSKYSEVLGVPLSIGGILYFMLILYLAALKYNEKTLKFILFSSILFLGPSLYLTGIEIFVLDQICVFCEISKLLMLTLAILAWSQIGFKKIPLKNIGGAVILSILLAGGVFLTHTNLGPGDKYNEFAECLNEQGFVVYGSATCQSCAKQRAMIGEEVFEEHILEIECNPLNPNSFEELCVEKNIEHTPTWMQEDADGNELYRFDAGVQKLEKLSEVSGCELPE